MANYILDNDGYYLGIVDNDFATHTKISVPLPGLTDAQRCKWDGGKWIVEDDPSKIAYLANQYSRDRRMAYPDLGKQLDMLFHDMTAGKGTKTGEWYKAIAKVKADNPK